MRQTEGVKTTRATGGGAVNAGKKSSMQTPYNTKESPSYQKDEGENQDELTSTNDRRRNQGNPSNQKSLQSTDEKQSQVVPQRK
jgi:hypothetical protein